jgi:histidine triad (HIT) family protein
MRKGKSENRRFSRPVASRASDLNFNDRREYKIGSTQCGANTKMDCIFCKIITGEISSARIYEDEYALAFLDANPNNHGHTLVVPKTHARNILDISEDALARMTPAVKKVSKAVFEGMSAAGLNITMNNEPVAGQVIFHLHIHIIPRFAGDGLKVWTKKVPYKEGEMEQVAEKIKNALNIS